MESEETTLSVRFFKHCSTKMDGMRRRICPSVFLNTAPASFPVWNLFGCSLHETPFCRVRTSSSRGRQSRRRVGPNKGRPPRVCVPSPMMTTCGGQTSPDVVPVGWRLAMPGIYVYNLTATPSVLKLLRIKVDILT
jgi:hypothetical protein